jgi:hypothetical protein
MNYKNPSCDFNINTGKLISSQEEDKNSYGSETR